MPEPIPASHADLFGKKAIAYLACHLSDGGILVNPVWVDHDGTHVVVNSARGRLKDRRMRADKRVTLCVTDPDDPFRYLEVRGEVVEITSEGAAEHIDRMARRYLGVERYPYHRPEEERVLYRIVPHKVLAFPPPR